MADFCENCARELHLPKGDMVGWTPPGAWEDGYAFTILCEGCGPIQVDPSGECCGGCLRGHPEHRPPVRATAIAAARAVGVPTCLPCLAVICAVTIVVWGLALWKGWELIQVWTAGP